MDGVSGWITVSRGSINVSTSCCPRHCHSAYGVGHNGCLLATLLLIGLGATIETASAQSCTVAASSTVTLTSGTCAITPGTTLNGSPAVHASTTAQINTNNVTINPFNGGSTGGLADTNGTIVFRAGASINGNWNTAASALSGGQIVFQAGTAINPAFGGGGTALLANGAGSGIQATGLTIGLNGSGNNVAARATNAAEITLTNDTISYAAGGGGNTGLWATGAGSQIISTGTTISRILGVFFMALDPVIRPRWRREDRTPSGPSEWRRRSRIRGRLCRNGRSGV